MYRILINSSRQYKHDEKDPIKRRDYYIVHPLEVIIFTRQKVNVEYLHVGNINGFIRKSCCRSTILEPSMTDTL